MILSVVIPTKNEEANIASAIRSFEPYGKAVEVVVVDNYSDDNTVSVAKSLGARVFTKGPERSVQRNFGWKNALGEWLLFLDADMILPAGTIDEIFSRISDDATEDAYWIPEIRTGEGFRIKARNFERSFYNGTCIDGLRLFSRKVLEKTGGYDEELFAAEDWDLDLRVFDAHFSCGSLRGNLIHNEKSTSLRKMLSKKSYYAGSFGKYKAKWHGRKEVKQQFSFFYRFFGVFFEKGKWKKVLSHPLLFFYVMFERFLVGLVYLFK
jgi:glycosyltransferase involved in cell wall biosynthesis